MKTYGILEMGYPKNMKSYGCKTFQNFSLDIFF